MTASPQPLKPNPSPGALIAGQPGRFACWWSLSFERGFVQFAAPLHRRAYRCQRAASRGGLPRAILQVDQWHKGFDR